MPESLPDWMTQGGAMMVVFFLVYTWVQRIAPALDRSTEALARNTAAFDRMISLLEKVLAKEAA